MASQPRNLRSVREIARRDILFAMARVPASDTLLVASSDGKVHELNAGENNPTSRTLADHGRYVTSVRLVGNVSVSGGYDGRLIWWDRDQESALRAIAAHGRCVRHIAVSPDQTRLASVGDDMIARTWDSATGASQHEMPGHALRTPTGFAMMLYVCVFSPDGRYLATGDRIGHVIVWEAATGRQVAAIDAPLLYTWDGTQRIRSIGGVRALAFSPDGTRLAVGGVGQINNVDALSGPARVEIFNWAKGERVAEFTGANGIVNHLVYHPDGNWLCAIGGGANGLIMFFDTANRTMIHQANLPMHAHDVAFNEDQTCLYAVGHNKIVIMDLHD